MWKFMEIRKETRLPELDKLQVYYTYKMTYIMLRVNNKFL